MGDVVGLRRARTLAVATTSKDDATADFRTVFDTTYPRLVRTLWFVVHDHDRAQEIAQDAFVDLHRQWRKVGSYDRPDLWVRRVALRKAQRAVRRDLRRASAERESARPEAVAGAPDLPDPQLIAAVASLPARQRAVVVLFYLEDRPMDEVADLLGISPATGFVHLHRARARLAALLSEPVDEEVDVDVR